MAEQLHNCWKTIGVYGDGSCELLETETHCKNCRVYLNAGSSFFDRDVSEELLQEWTDIYSAEEIVDSSESESFIVFRLEDEWYAIPTVHLVSVKDLRPIHSVPHRTNANFRGITNVEGSLVLCVNLHNILAVSKSSEKSFEDSYGYSRLVVISMGKDRIVAEVDEVGGIEKIKTTLLSSPPVTVAKSPHTFTKQIFTYNNSNVGVIDMTKLKTIVEGILR